MTRHRTPAPVVPLPECIENYLQGMAAHTLGAHQALAPLDDMADAQEAALQIVLALRFLSAEERTEFVRRTALALCVGYSLNPENAG